MLAEEWVLELIYPGSFYLIGSSCQKILLDRIHEPKLALFPQIIDNWELKFR